MPYHKLKKLTRIQRAIEIKDAVIPLLQSHGQSVRGALTGGVEGFGIWYRTPFFLPYRPTQAHARTGILCKTGHNSYYAPYGLDIWGDAGKVFNLEWDQKGNLRLATFRAGGWEQVLMAAIHDERM